MLARQPDAGREAVGDLIGDRRRGIARGIELREAASPFPYRQRLEQPVVRVEVERAMPAVLRDVVIRELRREQGALLAIDLGQRPACCSMFS